MEDYNKYWTNSSSIWESMERQNILIKSFVKFIVEVVNEEKNKINIIEVPSLKLIATKVFIDYCEHTMIDSYINIIKNKYQYDKEIIEYSYLFGCSEWIKGIPINGITYRDFIKEVFREMNINIEESLLQKLETSFKKNISNKKRKSIASIIQNIRRYKGGYNEWNNKNLWNNIGTEIFDYNKISYKFDFLIMKRNGSFLGAIKQDLDNYAIQLMKEIYKKFDMKTLKYYRNINAKLFPVQIENFNSDQDVKDYYNYLSLKYKFISKYAMKKQKKIELILFEKEYNFINYFHYGAKDPSERQVIINSFGTIMHNIMKKICMPDDLNNIEKYYDCYYNILLDEINKYEVGTPPIALNNIDYTVSRFKKFYFKYFKCINKEEYKKYCEKIENLDIDIITNFKKELMENNFNNSKFNDYIELMLLSNEVLLDYKEFFAFLNIVRYFIEFQSNISNNGTKDFARYLNKLENIEEINYYIHINKKDFISRYYVPIEYNSKEGEDAFFRLKYDIIFEYIKDSYEYSPQFSFLEAFTGYTIKPFVLGKDIKLDKKYRFEVNKKIANNIIRILFINSVSISKEDQEYSSKIRRRILKILSSNNISVFNDIIK